MDWIEFESFGLFCPDFADVFVRRETFESFETSAVVVGVDEVCEVALELTVAVIMIALDACSICQSHNDSKASTSTHSSLNGVGSALA